MPFEIAWRMPDILITSIPSGTLWTSSLLSLLSAPALARTSSLVILPLAPVPAIPESSRPISAAILRASGVTRTLANFATSSLWIRPFSPVPLMLSSAIPRSAASFLAAGVARILPFWKIAGASDGWEKSADASWTGSNCSACPSPTKSLTFSPTAPI